MDNEDKTPKPKDTGKPQDVSKPKDTRKLKKIFENDGYNKMNEAIDRMLGRLRKEHNMSVKDVKQRLHDDYGVDVAPSTISNWDTWCCIRDKNNQNNRLILCILQPFRYM